MKTTKKTPFDIEKAKNGALVVNGNNIPITILKYDLKNNSYPIVGLASYPNGTEDIDLYTINGQFSSTCNSESADLYILEENDYIDFEEIYDHKKMVDNNTKVVATGKLFTIADYYNKLTGLTVNWNNHYSSKFCIYYDHEINQYVADAWLTSNYGVPCFLNEKDAQAVIDNPNLKPILDTIFK